jgi:hypothetical protein
MRAGFEFARLANRKVRLQLECVMLRQKQRNCFIEPLEQRLMLTAAGDLLSNHMDLASTGQNLSETILTPANVTATSFGKLFDTRLDGQIYAQPLFKSNVNITRLSNAIGGGANPASLGIHNVLFVASQHNSLFAVDASTGQILWQDSFLQVDHIAPNPFQAIDPEMTTIDITRTTVTSSDGRVVGPIPNSDVQSSTIAPEIGILATPVIDPATNVLYVNATTREVWNNGSGDKHYVQRLWAINISDGSAAMAPVIVGEMHVPNSFTFSSFNGYEYDSGPYLRGTGNNAPDNVSPDSTTADGWATSAGDAGTPWGALGQTPMQAHYIVFNALLQRNRPALTIVNGVVYLGFASHGDKGPYYGWLLGYRTSDLANVVVFNVVPNWEGIMGNSIYTAQAGLWSGGQPISSDGTYLYFTTGNGVFNYSPSNFDSNYYSVTTDGHHVLLPLDNDYGDSVIKVAYDPSVTQTTNSAGFVTNGIGLRVVDYFTPTNENIINVHDADMASGGVLILPDTVSVTIQGTTYDHLLVTGSKESRIYLLNRDNMGGFNYTASYPFTTDYTETSTNYTQTEDPRFWDRALGEFMAGNINTVTNRLYGSPSYFNGRFYASESSTKGWAFTPQTFAYSSLPPVPPGPDPAKLAYPTPDATTVANVGGSGSTFTISANGTTNGIVWALIVNQNASTDALVAYNPTTMAVLYSSASDTAADILSRDINGNTITGSTGTKFSVPTVTSGMAYAATGGGTNTRVGTIVGYGLSSPTLHQPVNSNSQAASPNSIQLSWTRSAADSESGTRIERSLDGVNWTVIQFVANGNGATLMSYLDTTVSGGTKYFYRLTEVYALQSSAPSTTFTVTTPPSLSAAVSRKQQGAASFDLNLPLSGTAAIEPRTGGPSQLILSFGQTLDTTSTLGINFSSGTGSASYLNSTQISISLSGTTDAQTLTVTLTGPRVLNGSAGSYTLNIGVLLGDIDGSGAVNMADVLTAKLNSGAGVTSTNFLIDLNADGAINVADVVTAKLNSGHILPPTGQVAFFFLAPQPADQAATHSETAASPEVASSKPAAISLAVAATASGGFADERSHAVDQIIGVSGAKIITAAAATHIDIGVRRREHSRLPVETRAQLPSSNRTLANPSAVFQQVDGPPPFASDERFRDAWFAELAYSSDVPSSVRFRKKTAPLDAPGSLANPFEFEKTRSRVS